MSITGKLVILAIMLFCHIADDYYLQGILSQLKQREWWDKHAPYAMYRNDYRMALFEHAFSWSFVTTVPLLVYLFSLYVVPVVSKYVYRIGVFFYPLDLWEGQRGISSPLTQGAVVICIALGLICLYKDDIHDLLFNGMIYFGGMGTRVAMGFSPTLFASGDRTFMFMDVSIIMLVASNWERPMPTAKTQGEQPT